jgi:hypothetical protein
VPGLLEEGCKFVDARKTLILRSRASRGVSKDGTAHIVSILRDARKSALLRMTVSVAMSIVFVMAGLVPAIHVFLPATPGRGCPAQGRA